MKKTAEIMLKRVRKCHFHERVIRKPPGIKKANVIIFFFFPFWDGGSYYGMKCAVCIPSTGWRYAGLFCFVLREVNVPALLNANQTLAGVYMLGWWLSHDKVLALRA